MKPNLSVLGVVWVPLKAACTSAVSELNKQKHANGLCETSTADLRKRMIIKWRIKTRDGTMDLLWVISIEHAGIQTYMLSLSDHQKKFIFYFFRILLSETSQIAKIQDPIPIIFLLNSTADSNYRRKK